MICVLRMIAQMILAAALLAGCATKMSEEDHFLWNASTNAPSANR